jgi:hypothetical protein
MASTDICGGEAFADACAGGCGRVGVAGIGRVVVGRDERLFDVDPCRCRDGGGSGTRVLYA